MATEKPGFKDGGREAGADLSAKQFLAVKLNSSSKAVAIAAATDRPYGVLQNTPVSGQAAEIMLSGITKMVAGGTVAANSPVMIDANGKAVACAPGTDTTKYLIGTAVTGGANGEIISVAINCPSAGRAA